MTTKRRKILITGGTSGIGLELAKRLSVNHDVLITGSRAADDIVPQLPPGLIYVQASQTNPPNATRIIAQALMKLGWKHLDNVILNAGYGYRAIDALDDTGKLRNTLNINLMSSVLLARTLYPWLNKANGTLSIIGSVAHKGHKLFPAYAASKAGLDGFVRALRSEWKGRVTVQILHVGPTRTDMHAKAGLKPGLMRLFFIRPKSMATMLYYAIASKKSPIKLGWGRYFRVGNIAGPRL